jgi:hypothetical protein
MVRLMRNTALSTRHLVTPLIHCDASDNERKRFYVSSADRAKMGRGHWWEADLTDLDTDQTYHLVGCECSIPGCFCDAYIDSNVANGRA